MSWLAFLLVFILVTSLCDGFYSPAPLHRRCYDKDNRFPLCVQKSLRPVHKLSLRMKKYPDDDETLPDDEGMSMLNPVEKEYMENWNELMYSELRMRNAVTGDAGIADKILPDTSMHPRDVITTVVTALMSNDVPVVDNGCAITIRFCSYSNPLGKLSAADLSTFFRSTDFNILVTYPDTFTFQGETFVQTGENVSYALQDVEVSNSLTNSKVTLRFLLIREVEGSSWLIESISLRPE